MIEPRIVFFGLDGRFSTIVLSALARSNLRPNLVVRGVERPAHRRGELVRLVRARPNWFQRVLGDRPAASAEHERPSTPSEGPVTSLLEVARGLGLDVLNTSDPGALRARSIIHTRRPDLFVVAGFHRLIDPRVLDMSTRGGVNLHPGRLPAQRGPSPVFWTLKSGDTALGFTIHMLEPGEDDGDILATGEVEFEPGTDGRRVHGLCAQAALPLLIKTVRNVLAGEVVRTPQPKTGRGRCPRPEFRDCRIDPTLSAERVFTFVGGCAEAYPLFVECGGDRFFVARAESFDMEDRLSFEYMLTGDRLLLQCQPGVVELTLQRDGALFTAEYFEPAER